MFNQFKYYLSRGGIRYVFWRCLYKINIIDEFTLKSSYFFNKKLYNHFKGITSSMVYEELLLQSKSFEQFMGLNIEKPISYNDKIQWIKIHDLTSIHTTLSDKYLVRDWVKSKIGEKYLVPLVGGPWENGDEIDFSKLPKSYVIKANHGSGMNFIVKDNSAINSNRIRKMCNKWLKIVYGWYGMEHQYINIHRCIIAEKYIEQSDGNLMDYKIHCFNGVPKIIHVIGNRDLITHSGKEIFLDLDWEKHEWMYHTYDQYEEVPSRPSNLNEMLEIAEKLSQDFRYVRVDLYTVDGCIYFGEMTFTPASGTGKWVSQDANNYIGQWIDISSGVIK